MLIYQDTDIQQLLLSFTLIPNIIFIYSIKCQSKQTASILLSILFCLLLVGRWQSLHYYVFSDLSFYSPIAKLNVFITYFLIFFLALAIIRILAGFSAKSFVIIALILSFVLEVKGITNCILSLQHGLYNFYKITLFKNRSYAFYAEFVSDIFCSVSNILFYTTVLVFALQNKLPVFRKKPHTSPEEQELRRLTEQYQAGAISQEDYQARRAHIINNL